MRNSLFFYIFIIKVCLKTGEIREVQDLGHLDCIRGFHNHLNWLTPNMLNELFAVLPRLSFYTKMFFVILLVDRIKCFTNISRYCPFRIALLYLGRMQRRAFSIYVPKPMFFLVDTHFSFYLKSQILEMQ